MEKNLQLTVRSLSETPSDLRKLLSDQSACILHKDGMIHLRIGDNVYSCSETPEGTGLLMNMLPKSISSGIYSENDVWKEALNGTADSASFDSFRIKDHVPRAIILFLPIQHMEGSFLLDSIPLGDKDRAVLLENGHIALILHMKNRSRREAFEYAEAVTETMESEAGIVCFAGIGKPAENLDELPVSYAEAQSALETGIRYKMSGRVFCYDMQALERLADLIPDNKAEEFRKKILSPETEKILTDEMIETIRVFFLNDLNLSTTARQLFIHRNTLLYRMDKIRKTTGLDLRKFEDAVVFRFLMSFTDRQDNTTNLKEGSAL